MKSTRTRIGAIATALGCLVGVVAMVVPTSGANLPSAVRLHLGTDGHHFSYGTATQPLSTAKNGCQLTSDEPIIDLSSAPGQSAPGLFADSLGVKGTKSSSNGTPCSQVDGAETLQLTRGPALGNRQFSAVRLDLEMTGNAVVVLTLSSSTTSAVYHLQTGTSIEPAQMAEPDYDTVEPYFVSSGPGDEVDACASPQGSGPNSAGSDNCQWTVDPGFDFDVITLATQGGTVSLEGSGDFGNDPAFDTMLYLANTAPTANDDVADVDANSAVTIDVLANDSDVDGDPLEVTGITNVMPAGATAVANPDHTVTYTPPAGYVGAGSFTYRASDGELESAPATVDVTVFPVICSTDSVTDSDGDVNGTFTRLSDPFECKRYELEASDQDDAVLFRPQGDSNVSYRGVLTLGTDAAPAPGGLGSHSLLLRYDPTGGTTFQPVQWCIDPRFDGQGDVISATLPAGQTWCIASATTTGTASGDLRTTWQVYGEDDPRFTR